MGYTHGTHWTDELIKEKILNVKNGMELDRMPSRNEIKTFYNNDSLVNAISRSKGFAGFADELGLPMKKSNTYFGKSQERKAHEELIARGYESRRMPQNHPYDLLVNECIKVDVKVSRLYRGPQGNFYSCNIEKPFCTCDIYLVYLLNDDGTTKHTLIIPSKFVATITQISVGETKSKYYKYTDRWDYMDEYVEFYEGVS